MKKIKPTFCYKKNVSDEYYTKCVKFSNKLQKLVKKEGLSYFRFTYMGEGVKNKEGDPLDEAFCISDVLDINGNILLSYCL